MCSTNDKEWTVLGIQYSEVSHTKAQETKARELFCQVGSSNNGWNIIVPVNVAFSTHTHVCGDENNGAIGSGEVTIKCDGEVTAK